MNKMVTRFYYTLMDVIAASGSLIPFPDAVVDMNQQAPKGLAEIADIIVRPNAGLSSSWASIDDSTTKTMFSQYLWQEFADSIVAYIDVEHNPWEEPSAPTNAEIIQATLTKWPQYVRWLISSKAYYSYLIAQLETIRSNLLGPVTVNTVANASYSGNVSGNGTNTGTVSVNGTTASNVTANNTTSANGSGTNTGTVSVNSALDSNVSTNTSGSVVGSGTNTGTVSVADSANSTTSVNSVTRTLESDTPQNGGLDVFDTGYVSKASNTSVNSTTGVNSAGNTVTTNNLASSTNTTSNGTTATVTDSDSNTITTNNLASSSTMVTNVSGATLSSGNSNTVTTNNLATASNSVNSGSSNQSSLVSNDFNTPIERFREVQEKLRNLYADWADEFSRFVIYSAE